MNLENQMNPNSQDITDRSRQIVRTSMVGVGANLLLAAFKAVVGVSANSIAIIMDAVNNLSDAASSIITIVGTRLAGREPDRRHPYGYGRIEYLSALVISLLVLYAGITSFTESVKSILHPETPDYSTISLVIVAAAVVVKLFLGFYVKKAGERLHSDSLVNSGQDASMDAVISAATLVAAILYVTAGLSVEAWLGAVISIVIIKSGVEMIRDTLSEILGERADASLVLRIKKTVCAFPEVQGAYDLILHNYGPDTFNGSLHIEVPDTCTANELDELLRRIQVQVYQEHHVILTAIGVYSVNTKDPRAIELREAVQEAVLSIPHVLQMHGFYWSEEQKLLRFDVIVGFDSPDRRKTYQEVITKVQGLYPDYQIQAALDLDFSEVEA